MVVSPFEDVSNLSLTERHMFSLFAQYPDIKFDLENKDTYQDHDRSKYQVNDLDSSPVSTSAEGNKSNLSDSTAHTTPLRPLYLLQPQRADGTNNIASYLRYVRQTDLPEACRLCFTSLGQSIGAITGGMVPSTNGRYRINNTYFIDQCTGLLREARALSTRTREQIKQIDNLKTLIIFRATPPDDMLWAMYRQRAQLIVRLIALPSSTERTLIHGLALLYNNSIYKPVQILYDGNEIEAPTMRVLNQLYDCFYTWFTDYGTWCDAMKDLKQKYVQPLVDRILESQPLLLDVKNMSRAKTKAEVALANPVGPRMLPMDERVIKELNLSARRNDVTIKRKTRFRRERTI